MREETFTFESTTDGMAITADRWSGDGTPTAIVQISHGMGEHALRYRRFGEALVDAGYVVYTGDHRGHGRTAGSPDRLGDLGEGGWRGLVDDVAQLGAIARSEHPGVPFVLFGHSMGSFAAQQLMIERSAELHAAALSGSTAVDVIAGALDPTQPADLSAFNAPFEPARTEYDWLSRDPDEVDKYVADEACGFGVDAAGVTGMIEAAAILGDPARIGEIRGELPVHICSGTADPLAAGGELIELLAQRYRDAGIADVEVHLYPDARHEVLNETNRDEVTANLLAWLARVTA